MVLDLRYVNNLNCIKSNSNFDNVLGIELCLQELNITYWRVPGAQTVPFMESNQR